MSTRRPASRPAALGPSSVSMAPMISPGSAMRPSPYSPQAISPSLGPTNAMPSSPSRATFRLVAACCHMRTFMAGAASTFLSVASSTAVARSSARPCAILARRSAVAGATTTRSASRDSRMCPISTPSLRSKRSVNAFSSDSTESDRGVTKSAPPLVRIARTDAPRSFRRRTRSRLL
jgi:hypothetical protein